MNIQQILAIPSGDCVHCPCPLLETKIYIKCYCFAAYRLLSLKFSEWVLHSGLILSAHMIGVEGSLLDTKAGGACKPNSYSGCVVLSYKEQAWFSCSYGRGWSGNLLS
ncbi:hypothetical protein KP509_22G047000 [Ceratopteris richardii]|uniref:Uncharacterized protein n=1 Tax=Ceratopteris richardii TaxID=49495 RepID=A0A8T2S4P6_CERRI|nr:hypothetical protein KP509_22G047000 [Ceratopteris richardii]